MYVLAQKYRKMRTNTRFYSPDSFWGVPGPLYVLQGFQAPPIVVIVTRALPNILRITVLILALAVWQRVRMGIPLEVVAQNPSVLWRPAAYALQYVQR